MTSPPARPPKSLSTGRRFRWATLVLGCSGGVGALVGLAGCDSCAPAVPGVESSSAPTHVLVFEGVLPGQYVVNHKRFEVRLNRGARFTLGSAQPGFSPGVRLSESSTPLQFNVAPDAFTVAAEPGEPGTVTFKVRLPLRAQDPVVSGTASIPNGARLRYGFGKDPALKPLAPQFQLALP